MERNESAGDVSFKSRYVGEKATIGVLWIFAARPKEGDQGKAAGSGVAMRPLSTSRLVPIIFGTWFLSAWARTSGPGGPGFAACQLALDQPRYADAPSAALTAQKWCWSRLAVTSLYFCLDMHCAEADRIAGLDGVNQTCQGDFQSSLPPFGIISNYTDDDISNLRVLTREDAVYTMVLREVVVTSERLFVLSRDTLAALDYVKGYHYLYGLAMFIFWTGVVLIAILSRLWIFLISIRNEGWKMAPPIERSDGRPLLADEHKRSRPSLGQWLKRYITVPATFGYRCAQNIGWCTIPPRIQSLTITVFIIINIIFCIHGYWVFPDHIYWPDVTYQSWRYLSDRTGIISFANFPIIWLFGMRNNVLMWATGMEFGAYNNFHRWVARVATLQAVIHSIGYTILVFISGGWPGFLAWWNEMFWWAGELATIFMCLLLGFSVYWLRRGFYEVFLILHIVLSLLVLVTMLGHVSIFLLEPYDDLAWACFYIWTFDRCLRLFRILSFNLAFWNTRAKVLYNPKSDIVRLSIPYSTSAYQPGPGTYYYLHVLNSARFWESHPFTVASVSARRASHVEGVQATRQSCEPEAEQSPLLLDGQGGGVVCLSPSSGSRARSSKPPGTMTFLIRPYDGFTARLRDVAARSKGPEAASARVVVDGPYGHTQPLQTFENILFVVGGSGIVVPLSYLDVLSRSARVKSIRIVWAVRELSFAVDVVREDIGEAVDGEKVSVDIYITRLEDGGEDASLSERWPKGARPLPGRPNVRDEVEDAVMGAECARLAVVACGPGKMADDARRAVVDAIGKGGSQVEYFEESFTW